MDTHENTVSNDPSPVAVIVDGSVQYVNATHFMAATTMEGNVEQVQEAQLANQKEPMEHTLQTVECNVIIQEQEEQPAQQMEPMGHEEANNGNNNQFTTADPTSTSRFQQSALDLSIRQPSQSCIANNPSTVQKKSRKNFDARVVNILKTWLDMNKDDPFPDQNEKIELCKQTNISIKQLNDWFINTRRRTLRKNGVIINSRTSRRRRTKRLGNNGSNRSILQNNPQAVEENVEPVQEVQLANQTEPMEHTLQTVEGNVITREQEVQLANQREPMEHTLQTVEGNVITEEQEVQLANQREPMEHTLQTVESNVITQEQEEQPAHQTEPMGHEEANNGNNNHDDEGNIDEMRQNLFDAYIHHVNMSFQYAESIYSLGLGSEPNNILRQMYAYGYQHGLAHSNNNSNNAP